MTCSSSCLSSPLMSDKTLLPNWSTSTSLCEFSGVTCNINSRVVAIDLSTKKLHLDFVKVEPFLLTLPN